MGKFEEMNKNSDSVFTNEIDSYLLSQGYNREQRVFCKEYNGKNNFSTLVDISEKNIYFYRTDNGFYVSDEIVEWESSITDLETFKEFMDKVFEERFVI